MVASNYMPDVKVQISWDGGFRVPMASWTWTDVSDYVELADGISGTWGRGDERSTADANTLTLTLDNSDGRFTAARVTSPYYPNVKLYKPIRLKVDPVDGAEQTWHVGYITSWPVEWEDTSAYAKATVTASSRLARLGLNARWRSLIEETILADSPVAYYPLGEPEGATQANDVSGQRADPLTLAGAGAGAAVAFGNATGPGTDGLTAAEFTIEGQYLQATDAFLSGAPFTLVMFALFPALTIYTGPSFAALTPEGQGACLFSVLPSGKANFLVAANSVGQATSTSVVVDGATHCLAFTYDGTQTIKVYVDGVLEDTSTDAGNVVTASATQLLRLGADGMSTPPRVLQDSTQAHAALFDGVLSDARIAAIAAAGLTGFEGETTDTRFERYAAMAGIPAAEVAAETGSTTMVHVDTTGQNIVDMLRAVETTEAGVMFDARDGTLTLHNRAHRYSAAAVVTLDMAQDEVESGYAPRLDPSGLVNDATAANQAGTVTAHLKDDASIEANGFATTSVTTASEDVNEPHHLAGWMLHKYADPKARVPALTVNALAQVGKTVTCADVMAVTVGDKIAVANHPQQAAYSLTDYFVEGGSFAIGPESLTITWNLSPTDAEDAVLILDSATQGLLDTNVLAL